MNRYIACQAKPIKDIGAELEEMTFPLMQSLTQLYLYPHVFTVDHWRHEAWSFIHDVSVLKGRNKLPKKDFILKNTIIANMKYLNECVSAVLDKEYQFTPIDYNMDELAGLMDNYFDWLADKLSHTRYIAKQEVVDKLISIGL